MIVHVDASLGISLRHPDDFKRFHLAVAAGPESFSRIAEGLGGRIRFEGPETAWVPVALLRALPEMRQGGRAEGLDAMVAAAAPHGWISADGLAIKAHVEWDAA